MSDNTNQSEHSTSGPQEDEISLVDLLAVIVRHRRLIIGVPVVVGLAAALYLYALPALGVTERTVVTYEVRRDFEVAEVSEQLENVVPFDLVARAMSFLRDVRVVGSEYAEVFPEARAERTDEEYNTWIRSEVIGERLTTSYDEDSERLSVTFTGGDLELAEAFLEQLSRRVTEEVGGRYVERLDASEERLERSVEAAEDLGPESGGEFLAQAVSQLEALRAFRSQLAEPLAPTGEPVVFAEGTGSRSVRLVVAVLAAGFLAVFLAFVLEYARNVSRDPEESAKLKSAWRRE